MYIYIRRCINVYIFICTFIYVLIYVNTYLYTYAYAYEHIQINLLTGTVTNREHLLEMVEVLKEFNIITISDEIYERYVYNLT
jgi:hypothetical protein